VVSLGRRPLDVADIAYLVARVLVAASLIVLFAARILVVPAGYGLAQQLGLAVFTATTLGVIVAYLATSLSRRGVLWVVLPFDLVSGGMLLVVTHMYQDPMYTWFVGLVVIYAVALPRREAHAAAAVVALAYMAAHVIGFYTIHGLADYFLLAFKASAIVLVSVFVAEGNHRQIEREAELESSHGDVESLNRQLQRRLSELNAVSEITEVIHSSLDFDAIGPLVLEIVQKVIDVPACSLLVLDKLKAETLFSASAGLGGAAGSIGHSIDSMTHEGTLELEGGLFSCLTILDHGQMMVVFCAEARYIDVMRLEDRLVLQAVASELVVAVENSQLYKLTKRLSITDELTGLNNYRYMQQRLEDEFERARRFDRPLSLLMLDADDFKQFNDAHGHVAGDQALAELGRVLKSAVREIDVTARYGGEEFAVILPETDAAGAFVVAEKIREAVADHCFANADGERCVGLTVSVGLASFPMHAEDREALMRQADEALYQSKHLGRDRVRAAPPLVHPLGDPPSEAAEGRPA
jgi:diguanylate cyclase (GGDEF)-like protein